MCRQRTNFARLVDPLQGLHIGNAPLLPPAAASPPEGKILGKRREEFPHRGKGGALAPKGGWPVGPAKGKRFLSLTGPLGRRVQRVQRGRIAPQGKRLTGFSGLCRFPTARLSPTHNNLCVALLLQIMFAGVTPVRCAPPAAAMNYKVSVTGLAFPPYASF